MYSTLNGGRETSIVHMASAATAGCCTALATNPIWLIKVKSLSNFNLILYID